MSHHIFGNTNSTVHCLPEEVTVMIFKMLEFQDLKNAREVCKQWEGIITRDFPMGVTVDDKLSGNVHFVRKSVKKRITVVNIREFTTMYALFANQRVKLLTKIEINGFVHPSFVCCIIPRFTNLQVLIIRGNSFINKLSFDFDDQKTVLPNLKSLTVCTPYSPCRENPTQAFVCRDTELQFARNLFLLLSNISCPVLETLIIDGDVDQLRLPSEIDWKNNLLLKFVGAHNKTLKNMLIGESSILKMGLLENPNSPFPQFKSLHVSIHGKNVLRLLAVLPVDDLDWCKILRSQTELEYVNVGILWFPFVSIVLNKLPTTLRYVSIYWNSTLHGTFNASLLSTLTNLEQLELTFDGMGVELLVNYETLANCTKLKAIVLEQIMVPFQFVESVPTLFPRLEMLYLFRCSNAEFENQEEQLPAVPPDEFGITPLALSRVFNMRTLEYLFVVADDFLAPETTKREMITWLLDSARYDPTTNGYHIGCEPKYPHQYPDQFPD